MALDIYILLIALIGISTVQLQLFPGQPQPGRPQPGANQNIPGLARITPRPSGPPGDREQPQAQPQPMGQPGQGQGNRGACILEIRDLTLSCLSKNGLTLPLLDAILTNGTRAALPANSNLPLLRQRLCGVRTALIECIIPPTLTKRGKAPCVDDQEFNFAESQIVNRLTVLQDTCGAGSQTPQKECIKTLKDKMRMCHVNVGFGEEMFTSNSSEIKGAIIGKDRSAAEKFCGSRNELFKCMRNEIESCPGATEYMLMTGYDHDSMENSIKVLCQDIGVYVDGLSCFQTPTNEVKKCFDKMTAEMISLTAKQVEELVDKDTYFDEYCRIRVEHLNCDMQGWARKCSEASVGLKNEHECTLLPMRCQKDPKLYEKLQNKVCQENAFARNLRLRPINRPGSQNFANGPDNGSTTFQATFATIVLSVLSSFIMLL